MNINKVIRKEENKQIDRGDDDKTMATKNSLNADTDLFSVTFSQNTKGEDSSIYQQEEENVEENINIEELKYYPRFKKKELVIGKVLGRGAYSVVHEIQGFRLRDDEDLNRDSSSGHNRRLSLITTILRQSSSGTLIRRGSNVSSSFNNTSANKHYFKRGNSWGGTFLSRSNSRGISTTSSQDSNADVKDDDACQEPIQESIDISNSFQSSKHKDKSAASETYEEEQQDRRLIADNCIIRRQDGNCKGFRTRYALKCVSDKIRKKNGEYKHLLEEAIADLKTERNFLSRLSHPNIIKMRAITNVETASKKYFIIMDRLYDTLEDRIKKWIKRRDELYEQQHHLRAQTNTRRTKRGILKSNLRHGDSCDNFSTSTAATYDIDIIDDAVATTTRSSRRHSFKEIDSDDYVDSFLEEKKLLAERLKVAYDISSALSYLHSRNIIHRDIKPSNVGFDWQGNVKVFDFGLAKELNEKDIVHNSDYYDNSTNTTTDDEDDVYDLSVSTGTVRYMAPEVGKKQPYNEKCDTYSFTLMLWQILSLQKPFAELHRIADFQRLVWKNPEHGCKTYRPQTIFHNNNDDETAVVDPIAYRANQIWSKIPTIQLLLERGWTSTIDDRFHMIVTNNLLQKEVAFLSS